IPGPATRPCMTASTPVQPMLERGILRVRPLSLQHARSLAPRREIRREQRAGARRYLGGRLMDGIHLLGEWYGCPADTAEFTRAEALRAVCVAAVEAAGLTIVGDRFFQFQPQGVTGTVLLAESHLAIHTWPEAGFVTVDVYVCNYTTD